MVSPAPEPTPLVNGGKPFVGVVRGTKVVVTDEGAHVSEGGFVGVGLGAIVVAVHEQAIPVVVVVPCSGWVVVGGDVLLDGGVPFVVEGTVPELVVGVVIVVVVVGWAVVAGGDDVGGVPEVVVDGVIVVEGADVIVGEDVVGVVDVVVVVRHRFTLSPATSCPQGWSEATASNTGKVRPASKAAT
jgi:hypothetical protein